MAAVPLRQLHRAGRVRLNTCRSVPLRGVAASWSACRRPSAGIPLAGNHIRFVPEPEATMLAQYLLGRIEIGAAADDLGQSLVLDLRDIDRGVPGGEQGRGADCVADL